MPDLSSLALLAMLIVGMAIGDAALFGNAVHVAIAVPPKLHDTGFSQSAAEEAFASELTRLDELGASVIPMPHAVIDSRPSLLNAVAAPLNLSAAVRSLQSAVRADAVAVDGSVIIEAPDATLSLILTVLDANRKYVTLSLKQPNGDALALIRQGARATLEQIAPYRLALADFSAGLSGDNAALARAKMAVSQMISEPLNARLQSQLGMMHNLQALLSLLDANIDDAEHQLALASQLPDTAPVARVIIALNRAFVAIANKHPVDGARYYQEGLLLSQSISVPMALATRIDELGGIVAWADGEFERAEQLFRRALAVMPASDQASTYLAELMRAKGGAFPAANEQHGLVPPYGRHRGIFALAQTTFHVDVSHGGIKRWDE